MGIWVFFASLFVHCMSLGSTYQYSIPEGTLLSNGLSTAFVAKFALFVAFLLTWTILWGRILRETLKFPVIAGQIIGGVLIGPSVLNILGWSVFSEPLVVYDNLGAIYSVAASDLYLFFIVLCSSALTVTYLLWVAGHETDVRDIFHVGVTATTAGLLGAVLPIIMTVGCAYYILNGFSLIQSIGIGLIFSATSVSIPVTMLVSKRKMHLKSSKATLGAAIIDDVFSVVLLSMFFIALQAGTFGVFNGAMQHMHNATIAEALVYMLVSFAVIFFTGYFVIPPILEWLKKNHSSFLLASFASGAMLFYFAFAELIGGLAGITGAFFAGLFHRMGDKRHQAEKVITPFIRSFLLPIFLGSIGLQVNVSILSSYQWLGVVALLITAIISKMFACYISIFLSNSSGRRAVDKWTWLEGYLFGSSMVARGEVGLVIATILRGSQVITADQYVIAVVVIVLTTVAAPFMLAIGFHRLDLIPEKEGFSLNLGLFKVMGTQQMFNIIVGRIEAMGSYKTSINMSEGCKIVNLEGENVKIVYDPELGIVFRGKRQRIEGILHEVRKAILDEVDHIPDNKEMDD
ncbi:MAG: cation:proton antiporter [Candidatus Dependentiae bacterium]